MKVICKSCGNLTEETEAIKMNMADFEVFKMLKHNTDFCSYSTYAHLEYTQICKECYDKVYGGKS